jgi:hypothetical protein
MGGSILGTGSTQSNITRVLRGLLKCLACH